MHFSRRFRFNTQIIILIVGYVFHFSSSTEQNYETKTGANNFHRNVVVSNGPECAPIGM